MAAVPPTAARRHRNAALRPPGQARTLTRPPSQPPLTPASLPPGAEPGYPGARPLSEGICSAVTPGIGGGDYWRSPDRRPEHWPVITTGATHPPERDAEASTTRRPHGAVPRPAGAGHARQRK